MLLSIPGAYGLFFDTYFHTLIPREPPFDGFNFYIKKNSENGDFRPINGNVSEITIDDRHMVTMGPDLGHPSAHPTSLGIYGASTFEPPILKSYARLYQIMDRPIIL